MNQQPAVIKASNTGSTAGRTLNLTALMKTPQVSIMTATSTAMDAKTQTGIIATGTAIAAGTTALMTSTLWLSGLNATRRTTTQNVVKTTLLIMIATGTVKAARIHTGMTASGTMKAVT